MFRLLNALHGMECGMRAIISTCAPHVICEASPGIRDVIYMEANQMHCNTSRASSSSLQCELK